MEVRTLMHMALILVKRRNVTIDDYNQHYRVYWLLCAPTGSTFRSSVLIARTIHEFRIIPSTNSWCRFVPRGKAGNTGIKHVCG